VENLSFVTQRGYVDNPLTACPASLGHRTESRPRAAESIRRSQQQHAGSGRDGRWKTAARAAEAPAHVCALRRLGERPA